MAALFKFQNPFQGRCVLSDHWFPRSYLKTASQPAGRVFAKNCNTSPNSHILRVSEEVADESEATSNISKYAGTLNAEKCVELLSQMQTEKKSVKQCLNLFEWMRSQPSPLTPAACSMMFNLLSEAEIGDQMIFLLQNLTMDCKDDFLSADQFNVLLSALVSQRRYDDAWKLFEAMEEMNLFPDHVTCLIMFRFMRETGKKSNDLWDLFESLNKKGVEWCPEISCELIKFFCEDGLKKEALILLIEMEKKGFPADVLTYNILIEAYCKSDQIAEAEGLFAEMKGKHLNLQADTYNIFLNAYGRRTQPEIVEKLLEEMVETGITPNEESYAFLISAYGKEKKTHELAVNAFNRMKGSRISPSLPSYTALIEAHSVGGYHEMAFEAFENMVSERISPSIETYMHLIAAFRRQGDPVAIMKIWRMMKVEKVKLSSQICNLLLDGFAKRGRFLEARQVFDEMEELGLVPDVVSYNILLNAYARGGENAKLPQILKEMENCDVEPDSVSYVTVIYAYVRANDFRRAVLYHKVMVKNAQLPDFKSYEKLRAVLDVKAGKSKKDKHVVKILSSKFGSVKTRKQGKKDEFWKGVRKREKRNG